MNKKFLITLLIFVPAGIGLYYYLMQRQTNTHQSFVPRTYFGAKFELEKTVLHGAGQDPDAFRDYVLALGTECVPAIYMTYVKLFDEDFKIAAWGENLKNELRGWPHHRLIPQIGISLVSGNENNNDGDKEVSIGNLDGKLQLLCRIIHDLSVPVFVRIGYEFEGRWNEYHPETYKKAFIRITEAFRKQNLLVATVWCSAGCSAAEISLNQAMAYYPGDEWVDWWGVDIFDIGDITCDKTTELCKRAATHKKPVMIGESTSKGIGTLPGKESWNLWFAPYFDLIHQHPEIKAFCYINWDWIFWSDKAGLGLYRWGDARIQQNNYVSEMFRREMKSPLYQHAHKLENQSLFR